MGSVEIYPTTRGITAHTTFLYEIPKKESLRNVFGNVSEEPKRKTNP
jgi:hypothetical protein